MTVRDEFTDLDALGQAELVRSEAVSPLDLVEAAIARIEAMNPSLNAVITPLFDEARAQAVSSSLPDGPFRGVPIVLKDFICHSAGDVFFEGMGYLKRLGWTEAEDTFLAARFRDAGFVTVGKTNTSELGMTADTQTGGLRRDSEPVEHRSHAVRLQRRVGGRGCVSDGPCRPRERWWRVDSHPSWSLRTRRVEADQYPGQPGP